MPFPPPAETSSSLSLSLLVVAVANANSGGGTKSVAKVPSSEDGGRGSGGSDGCSSKG
jgi:hypothetical protein